MGLARSVVGILANYNNFHRIKRRAIEGIEYVFPRGINRKALSFFLLEKSF